MLDLSKLPPDVAKLQMFGTDEAAKFCGYSTVHFRQLVRKGVAPKPIRLSARKLGFRLGDLTAWLDSRRAA